MILYVPLEDPVKIMKVKLKNNSAIQREISITYYAEWVLGVERQSNAPHIVTEWHESAKVLIARNTYQETFREATAFLGMHQPLPADSSTVFQEVGPILDRDRNEFIGRNGTMEHPAAIERIALSGSDRSLLMNYVVQSSNQIRFYLKRNRTVLYSTWL